MPLEAPAGVIAVEVARPDRAWRMAAARVVLAGLAAMLVAGRAGAAMADQWWSSSTYEHLLLVPAILGWLVWARRDVLAALSPRAWWPGVGWFAAAVVLWVLGRLAGVALVAEAGAVAMLAACVPALLGLRVAMALRFPLAYMAFLVPVGDEAIPLMQRITAAITVALVRLSGVPARIDGVFITTPAGLFQIAEACSGMKFLAAMVAFGVLAGHVCFVSWRRRAAFLAACVAVPVLANGVRAWGTIWIAQFVGAARAGGIDHIIYGWFFFAAVIAAVIAGGWRFFDRPAGAPLADLAALQASPWGDHARADGRAVLAALVAVMLGGAAWAAAGEALVAPVPAGLVPAAVPGWRLVPAEGLAWAPRAAGAALRWQGAYVDGAGHRVDVFIGLWATQRDGAKADGFGEGAWDPLSRWAWQGPAVVPPPYAPGEGLGDRLLTLGARRMAVTTYAHGGWAGAGGLRWRVLGDRLRLRAVPTEILIVSAQEPGAAAAIGAFRRAIGPAGAWMDRARPPR